MNTLDSRSLRYTDCFMQKFSAAGEYMYQLLAASGEGFGHDDDRFSIQVRPRESKSSPPTQHHITVVPREGKLVADPPRVEIESDDVVVWNTPDSLVPGYIVRGKGQSGKFDSGAMEGEAAYSHSFGAAGEYIWLDPHGGPATGTIEVQPVDASDEAAAAKWREKLGEGTVIVVSGKKVSPGRIKILVGQTVFWAVEKSSGMAITDARLVSKSKAAE